MRQFSLWTSLIMPIRDCCNSLISRVASVNLHQNSEMKETKKGTTFSAIHIIWEEWPWRAVQPRSKEWGKSTVQIQIQTLKASSHSLSTKWQRVNLGNFKKSIKFSSNPTLQVAQPRKSSKNTCRCPMKTWIYKMKKRCWRRHPGTQRSQRPRLTWVRAQSDKI
jgi:hypothetical protein